MRYQGKPPIKGILNFHRTRDGIPSDSFIRWKTALDAIQNPLTLTALLVCVISTIYLLFLAPMFGTGLEACALSVTSGIFALFSYLRRYFKNYPAVGKEIMARLELGKKQLNEAELKQLTEELKAGFCSITSGDGLELLARIISEYEQLETALSRQRVTDPLSVSIIPGLAEETYRRALGVLSDALELMKAIRSPGADKLKNEIAELERDIQTLTSSPGQEELIDLKKTSLAFCKKRLDILNRVQLRIAELLFHARRCEIALQSTRIEMAAIRVGSSKTRVDSVIETLQERINQMKEVQDELQKLGY